MEIVNRNKVKAFITKDTSIIREILAPANSSLKNQSLAEDILEPGKSTIEHYHPKTEEIYYVLEGKGLMKIDGEKQAVSKGDGIVILPGKKHKLWNTGNTELIILCCCSPAYTDADTVIIQ